MAADRRERGVLCTRATEDAPGAAQAAAAGIMARYANPEVKARFDRLDLS